MESRKNFRNLKGELKKQKSNGLSLVRRRPSFWIKGEKGRAFLWLFDSEREHIRTENWERHSEEPNNDRPNLGFLQVSYW